jgi:hypothetical protein
MEKCGKVGQSFRVGTTGLFLRMQIILTEIMMAEYWLLP